MSKAEQIEYIKAFAVDLKDMAEQYANMASITDSLTPGMIDYLYSVAVQTNAMQLKLANKLKVVNKKEGRS